MNRTTARNVLILIGLFVLSKLVTFTITLLLTPVSNRLTYVGDAGTVAMWLWQGLPEALVAALAAAVMVCLIEAKKPLFWVSVLALLYLYDGILHAWDLAHGWQNPPHTSDYVGIVAQALIPPLVCLIMGDWRASAGLHIFRSQRMRERQPRL